MRRLVVGLGAVLFCTASLASEPDTIDHLVGVAAATAGAAVGATAALVGGVRAAAPAAAAKVAAAAKRKSQTGREIYAFENTMWQMPCEPSKHAGTFYRRSVVYEAGDPARRNPKGEILHEIFSYGTKDCSDAPKHAGDYYPGERYAVTGTSNGTVYLDVERADGTTSVHSVALSGNELVRRITANGVSRSERLPRETLMADWEPWARPPPPPPLDGPIL